MASSTKPDEIDWLYPDLLSKDGLVHILRQRQIKHTGTDLENLEKEALVELYNRYILPMPQRKYRRNRGGSDRTKKQILLNRKRKIAVTIDDYLNQPPSKKGMPCGPKSGLVNSFNHPGAPGSRLKPPPSCVNFDKKVVKLSSSKNSDAASNDIIVKDFTKKVKLNSTTSQVSQKTLHETKNSTETNAAQETTSSPTPKKIKKISWP